MIIIDTNIELYEYQRAFECVWHKSYRVDSIELVLDEYALADDMAAAVVEGVTLEELPGDLWKWSRLTGEQTSINCS